MNSDHQDYTVIDPHKLQLFLHDHGFEFTLDEIKEPLGNARVLEAIEAIGAEVVFAACREERSE